LEFFNETIYKFLAKKNGCYYSNMSVYQVGNLVPRGSKIIKDGDFNQMKAINQLSLPFINSLNPPPPFNATFGGGLAYDVRTKSVWYSDGRIWRPVSVSATGNIENFSFTAGANQNIIPNVDTPIIMWTTAGPPPVYSTLIQWNLSTGIYTATQAEQLYLSACICWAAGISNLGDRSLRIEYQSSGGGGWQIASESTTQGEPKTNVETPQMTDMTLTLGAGDQVRVTVEHSAPFNLQIAGGIHTTLCGYRTII
jgi:hypothetical protein